jgi:hypothetical protein
MHKLQVRLHPAYVLVWALLTPACVDEFEGSNIQLDFGPLSLPQAPQGQAPVTVTIPGVGTVPMQLPSITHYSLYGIKEIRDSAGTVIQSDYTEIQRFEIHQIVERNSPCFIDPQNTRFPGVHVTQFEARMKVATGIMDLTMPPPGATENDIIDVSTAQQRTRNVTGLGRPPAFLLSPTPRLDPGGLKAVTSASPRLYPAVATTCIDDDSATDPSLIPPPNCIGDRSNELRLSLCQKLWDSDPAFYSGTDRVLTDPNGGTYFGIVTGVNPINGAVLGGTQFFVKNIYADYSLYSINWQFDDLDGDGQPNYPPGFPPSDYGTVIVSGRPSTPTRGVTRVVMGPPAPNAITTQFAVQMAIFSNIGGDDVHF